MQYNNLIQEADNYIDSIWLSIEGYFTFLQHSAHSYVSSLEGAREILWIFKDWVENNSGWEIIQNTESRIREITIHKLIFLAAKKYIECQNLDMNIESNIGVGQEDIKISRGNDKTIIEVKLSTNPHCKDGYEKQLPRYAEAEHTKNMIFVLVIIDDNIPKFDTSTSPEYITIDARPQKSASKL